MVPTLPRQVAAIDALLGGEEVERSITLTLGPPRVMAQVVAGDAERITVGDRVRLVGDRETSRFSGTVVKVGAPRMDAEEGYVSDIDVRPNRRLVLGSQGKPVQLSIIGSLTPAELLVPISTVWQESDGTTHVMVVDARGDQRRVEVAVRGQEGGLVAVRPMPGARLQVGDDVLIGDS